MENQIHQIINLSHQLINYHTSIDQLTCGAELILMCTIIITIGNVFIQLFRPNHSITSVIKSGVITGIIGLGIAMIPTMIAQHDVTQGHQIYQNMEQKITTIDQANQKYTLVTTSNDHKYLVKQTDLNKTWIEPLCEFNDHSKYALTNTDVTISKDTITTKDKTSSSLDSILHTLLKTQSRFKQTSVLKF